MKRSKKIVLLAHCILNSNSKVVGLSQYPGCLDAVITPLIQNGTGIIQLPCPEMTFIGLKRWGMTREQYDIPTYKNHCRNILMPIVYQIQDYLLNGYIIEGIVGVDGSPSCGVNNTCIGYSGGEWNKATNQHQSIQEVPGKGVMIEILTDLLLEEKIVVSFSAIKETADCSLSPL
ncbi:MAG: DUF523 domain-containing protein [Candidatus Riflebacteria bacterium]|nr:DUF523 domain-containing protein [Candidatus Riflebacteria bacterium]